MPRVTDEHRAARRLQIIEATTRCAAREGFHKMTMAQVIAESGLSAGAVYGYFKNKTALIHAIADRAVGSIAERLVEIADGPEPVTVPEAFLSLLGTVEEMSRTSGTDFPRVALHAWSEAARDDEVLELVALNVDRVHDGWLRVLDRAARDGAIAPDGDRDAMARVLVGMMPGFLLQGMLLGRIGSERYAAGLVDLVRAVSR